MSGSETIIVWKMIILSLQLIYWTTGLFMLSISIWSTLEPYRGAVLALISTAGEDLLQVLCFLCGLFGSWMFSIGLFGTLGAVQERRRLLLLSGGLLLFLLFVEVLFFILMAGNLNTVKISFRDVLKLRLIEEYGKEEFYSFKQAVDVTQYQFRCCGVDSWKDFTNNNIDGWRRSEHSYSTFSLTVPRTCCKLLNYGTYRAWEKPQPENLSGCQSNVTQINDIYRWKKGCYGKIDTWLGTHHKSGIFLLILFNLFQILTLYTTAKLLKKLDLDESRKPIVYL